MIINRELFTSLHHTQKRKEEPLQWIIATGQLFYQWLNLGVCIVWLQVLRIYVVWIVCV